jgi:hypothetical protein
VRATRPLSVVAAVVALLVAAPAAWAAAWSTVASPNPSGGQDVLNEAGRLPRTNVVYAVGRTNVGTLVLRSANGGASWQVETAPSPGTGTQLFGVSVRTRGVWAVGYLTGPSRTSTVTLRRTSGTWRRVASPNPDFADQLYGVVTTPAGTWAVGTGTGVGGNSHPLILHWTGSAWKQQPAPALPKGNNQLFGIAGKGSHLWAFGQRQKSGGILHPLALHHNASGWHVSKTPDPARGGESFFFGGTISGSTVWAVGGRGAGSRHALAERHTAAGWKPVTVPDGAGCTATNELAAVVPIPGTKQLWAVGDCSPGLGNRTLVERHRNGGWHQVSSPTPDSSGSFLTGVVALSQTRAAAVGYRTPAGFRTLALIHH